MFQVKLDFLEDDLREGGEGDGSLLPVGQGLKHTGHGCLQNIIPRIKIGFTRI